MIELTPEQDRAMRRIELWHCDADEQTSQKFVLAGLAGTGKTTMMKVLRQHVDGCNIRFLAPTNKAASVLQTKGIPASTIHREFYQLIESEKGKDPVFEFCGDRATEDDLYVIDEASMIDADMLRDLLSTEGRFLFVGDHGQLPPVGIDPKMMQNADVRLEQIMRQAADSEILSFAHHLRVGGDPFAFKPRTSDVVLPPPGAQIKRRPAVDMWLCWRNFTRVQLNMWVIKESTPKGATRPESVLVQIRGNYPTADLFNGEVYVADQIQWDGQTGHPVVARLGDDNGSKGVFRFHPANWHREKRVAYSPRVEDGVLADYGFATTVHSAQGSEWDRVAVVDEAPHDEATRWRYTAATRAAKQLIWLPPQALPISYPKTAEGVF